MVLFVGVMAKEAYPEEGGSKQKSADYDTFTRILNPRVKAPDFSLKNLKGDRVALQDMRGKVVMINFRTTW
jgi:cytochrome oxidase Cu insertion factor (SCO1/SenC/PrrC family)